jgi:hypothetical protein
MYLRHCFALVSFPTYSHVQTSPLPPHHFLLPRAKPQPDHLFAYAELCPSPHVATLIRDVCRAVPSPTPQASGLKAHFPTAKWSSGHRLFILAFMLASKIICDDTYSNKSWCIVGQGMFTLREINPDGAGDVLLPRVAAQCCARHPQAVPTTVHHHRRRGAAITLYP